MVAHTEAVLLVVVELEAVVLLEVQLVIPIMEIRVVQILAAVAVVHLLTHIPQ